jgi:hypothetical protein
MNDTLYYDRIELRKGPESLPGQFLGGLMWTLECRDSTCCGPAAIVCFAAVRTGLGLLYRVHQVHYTSTVLQKAKTCMQVCQVKIGQH